MGRSATCRVIYATAIALVRKTTVSINTRTIILAIGLNSAICPKALSVGASINRASRAGRPIGLTPHRAIGPRGLRSRRRASSGRGGRFARSDLRGVGAQGCIVDWPPASAGPAIAEQRSMHLVYRRATCRCVLRCRAGSSLTLRKRSASSMRALLRAAIIQGNQTGAIWARYRREMPWTLDSSRKSFFP